MEKRYLAEKKRRLEYERIIEGTTSSFLATKRGYDKVIAEQISAYSFLFFFINTKPSPQNLPS